MNKHTRYIVFLLLALLHTLAYSEATTERVLWEKRPISVFLTVNQERIIHFPDKVRYWMPDHLNNKVSILSANGVLYVTAHERIEKTRIRVQSIASQTMYLLDLIARDDAGTTPELVIMDKKGVQHSSLPAGVKVKPKPSDWYVRLTRFAAQSLYAEEHLMPSDKDITRVKVDQINTVPLVRGGDVEARPVAAWQGGGLYITAVRLRNRSDKTIPIIYDRPSIPALPERFIALYSDLRGQWLSAAVQEHYLAASGHPHHEDMTSLYLISARPFQESL